MEAQARGPGVGDGLAHGDHVGDLDLGLAGLGGVVACGDAGDVPGLAAGGGVGERGLGPGVDEDDDVLGQHPLASGHLGHVALDQGPGRAQAVAVVAAGRLAVAVPRQRELGDRVEEHPGVPGEVAGGRRQLLRRARVAHHRQLVLGLGEGGLDELGEYLEAQARRVEAGVEGAGGLVDHQHHPHREPGGHRVVGADLAAHRQAVGLRRGPVAVVEVRLAAAGHQDQERRQAQGPGPMSRRRGHGDPPSLGSHAAFTGPVAAAPSQAAGLPPNSVTWQMPLHAGLAEGALHAEAVAGEADAHVGGALGGKRDPGLDGGHRRPLLEGLDHHPHVAVPIP